MPQTEHFQERYEAREIVSQEADLAVFRDANSQLEACGNILFCFMVIFVGEGRTFKEDKSYPLLKDKWTRGRREGEFLFKN